MRHSQCSPHACFSRSLSDRVHLVQVYNEIEIVPPYALENCAFLPGSSGNEMMLERVRTVLRERSSARVISSGGDRPAAAGA